MKPSNEQARDSLVKLVEHVFEHRDGLLEGIYYEQLASKIDRLNKHGNAHAHGMGQVLGIMGNLLRNLEGEWGEAIPQIQSLVVLKTGNKKKLPADGIKEFWPDYPTLTPAEKLHRTMLEYQNILAFGSRWNDVLEKLGLPRIKVSSDHPFGTGAGESAQHRALKEWVRQHPELVGATSTWNAFVEYALPSLDVIDVLFKSSDKCIAVEVKSAVSDSSPFDYERGIYQTVKYLALLKAMSQSGDHDIPPNIDCVLVLESALPDQFRKLATVLGIKVLENVKVKN